jgi:hypothetical protein
MKSGFEYFSRTPPPPLVPAPMPVCPGRNRVQASSSIAAWSGVGGRSWIERLHVRGTEAAHAEVAASLRASCTPATPRAGSMLANGDHHVRVLSAAAIATSSFGTPGSPSWTRRHRETTHAICRCLRRGDSVGTPGPPEQRAEACLQLGAERALAAFGYLGVRVHVERDEIVHVQ